jgi:hypothetical protein
VEGPQEGDGGALHAPWLRLPLRWRSWCCHRWLRRWARSWLAEWRRRWWRRSPLQVPGHPVVDEALQALRDDGLRQREFRCIAESPSCRSAAAPWPIRCVLPDYFRGRARPGHHPYRRSRCCCSVQETMVRPAEEAHGEGIHGHLRLADDPAGRGRVACFRWGPWSHQVGAPCW